MPRNWLIAFCSVCLAAFPHFVKASPSEGVIHRSLGPEAGPGGWRPIGGLIEDNLGDLYGTTLEGGLGDGEVFKLAPPLSPTSPWTKTTLFEFHGTDSLEPSNLAGHKDSLYGTALGGKFGFGVVFKLSPPLFGNGKWTETVLHAFTGGSDGAYPSTSETLLVDQDSTVYGTTVSGGTGRPHCAGGGADGCGIAFKLTSPKVGNGEWTETVLHFFRQNGGDGIGPDGNLLMDASGNLYGTTASGGPRGGGTIYKLTPSLTAKPRWDETLLTSFGHELLGRDPNGLVADAAGALYGVTQVGGPGGGATVYKLSPPTSDDHWSFSTLHEFGHPPVFGVGPQPGLVIDSSGAIYGATYSSRVSTGGNGGTIYKLTPPIHGKEFWRETTLHRFGGETFQSHNGDGPAGQLLLDKTGAIYGTTAFGGRGSGGGVVFRLVPGVGPSP